MPKDKNSSPESLRLRRQAEDLLRVKAPLTPGAAAKTEDLQRVHHELEVHQIELRLQYQELRQARDDAEEALARFIDLYEFAPVGYLTLDPKGTILAVNLTGASLLGEDRARLAGRPLRFFLTDSQPHFPDFLDQVFSGPDKQFCEVTLRPSDKTELYVRLEAQAAGSGKECRVVMVDITAIRQEELYHLQLECVEGYAICLLDEQGTILNWNPGAERLEGYRAKEIIGKNFSCLYSEQDRHDGKPEQELRKAATEGRFAEECWRIAKDGRGFWADVVLTPLRDEKGHLWGFSKVTHDITARKKAEEERDRLYLQLEAVLDNITEAVVIADSAANVVNMNRSALDMYGYERNDPDVYRPLAVYQETFEISDLEGHPLSFENWPLVRALHGESFVDCELRVLRKDTGKSWVGSYNGSQVRGKSGAVALAVITVRDITERKRVEEALRESEARFHAIFDLAAVGIAQVSLNGRWILMNQKLSDTLGYSYEELKNITLQQISHHDDIEPHLAHIRRLLAGEVPSYSMEKRYLCKDGTTIWVNLNVTLVRDQRGEPEYFIAIVENINKRKMAQEALRESEERYRLLADTVPVMIWETGPDGRCTFLNRAWTEFTGRSQEQELGALADGWTQEMVHPEDQKRCMETFLSAFREHRNFSMEYRLRRSDGQYGWVANTGEPRLASNGDLLGYIGTCFDITERKRVKEKLEQDKELLAQKVSERTEELNKTVEKLQEEINERIGMALVLSEETAKRHNAQQELREKELLLLQQGRLAAMGEMIGNIAHQWRQPLNILGLHAQEMLFFYKKGEFTTEYLEESVKKVLETISHMSQTIDDFRFFFKPGKERQEFRVLEMIGKTLSLLEGSLKEERINPSVIPTDDPVVNGYPNEFCQVLLNIIGNAKDAFLAKQVPSPEIRIVAGMEEGRCVVTITDNAGGIPEDILSKIFDPYFTTKGAEKGTGVGLFMSKIIVEKNMGGTLSACNVEGGAQFRIVV